MNLPDRSALPVALLAIAIAVLSAYYTVFAILPERGGDLLLRIAESKYFWNGINPYDVWSGRIPKIEELGHPDVYSFVSYIVMKPWTHLPNETAARILFAAVDIAALVCVVLVLRAHKVASLTGGAIAIFILMLSVFFLQQVYTLNYNAIAMAALLVAMLSVHKGKWAPFLLSGFLVGLKPSLCIPLLLFLLLDRRWFRFATLAGVLVLALLWSSFQIGITPLQYATQLASVAETWSGVANNGLIAVYIYFVDEASVLVSLLLSVGAMVSLKGRIPRDPVSAYGLCAFCGLAFFYNNVHAWILILPYLMIWLDQVFRRNGAPIWLGVAILLFLLAPRLLGLWPEELRDTYALVHNVVRFSLFGIVVVLFKPSLQHGVRVPE